MATDAEFAVRAGRPDDRTGIVDLARAALGWAGDERDERYFRWKHDENPAGASPRLVAESGGRIVGFRTFLRWPLAAPDGDAVRAVRAVDTATHPDVQGRGLFTLLTRRAVEALRDEGTDLVFNTPNDKSRPGYLKMGWTVVGRPPLLVRPSGPLAAARLVRARQPAEKWSLPIAGGDPAPDVFADTAGLSRCIESLPRPTGLATAYSPDHMRWRYGFPDLAYAAVTLGTVAGGVAVFRRRRRGPLVEAAVCEVLVPGGERGAEAALLQAVARAAEADYLLRVGPARRRRGREMPLRRGGPVLTALALRGGVPPLAGWQLGLGDLELL